MPVDDTGIRTPPATVKGILKELGPGLIVAGAVVGSGELIATTATGAEAGFVLLWLILIGCMIKVFVQVEVGRYVIVTGKTTLTGMSEVPGPRVGRTNWVLWFWIATIIVTTFQLGGIVGGVGQALSISAPLTQEGREVNAAAEERIRLSVRAHEEGRIDDAASKPIKNGANDQYVWAAIVTAITVVLLWIGRYRFIQVFVTAMIACFTLATLVNLVALQMKPEWAIDWGEVLEGLKFRLPEARPGHSPVATALATFGIIGVAAGELVFYPYWCLEAGYAKFVGPRDDSPEWADRARGWLTVLRWDAWCSMAVYTTSTVVFYLLGAAILHPVGLVPKGTEMIRTLGLMYEPAFGATGKWIFLIGAVAVLYSTFFVTNASKARTVTDALKIVGLRPDTDRSRRFWLKLLCVIFPVACLVVYVLIPSPKELILAGGVMQSILLPVMAATALYFRYRRRDDRLVPGRTWDLFLWISAAGLLVAGAWTAYSKFGKWF